VLLSQQRCINSHKGTLLDIAELSLARQAAAPHSHLTLALRDIAIAALLPSLFVFLPRSFVSSPSSSPLPLYPVRFSASAKLFTFSIAFASVFVSITLFQLVCLDPAIISYLPLQPLSKRIKS
jgi:hypothetical protein